MIWNEKNLFRLFRKQRQTSAPSKTHQNPDIEQLKQNIETKKTQRLSRQQQIRETLSSLSIASVSSTGRNSSFVCSSSISFILIFSFQRSTTEWNRFDQLEKSYDKTQKRIAPSLIA